jgi:protein phosphatase
MNITACGTTHVGLRRDANEDHYLVDLDRRLFAVADGMGGHAAGEVASRLAIDTLATALSPGAESEEAIPREQILTDGFQAANRRIGEEIRNREDLRGMGTTLVAAHYQGDHLVVAHVGDSRAYLIRQDKIVRLTRDHSWVNDQVQLGILSEEEAQRHPFRNVITRALGSNGPMPVDTVTITPENGDRVLLCSDGLNGMVSDQDIFDRTVAEGDDLEAATRSLVEAANQAGGEDNITVVLLRFAREADRSAES